MKTDEGESGGAGGGGGGTVGSKCEGGKRGSIGGRGRQEQPRPGSRRGLSQLPYVADQDVGGDSAAVEEAGADR